MDALSDVLRVAQLTGGVFLHAEFTAPWCIAARAEPGLCAPFLGPTSHIIPYHYVAVGELELAVEGEQPFSLKAGEIAILPRNDLHRMGSDLNRPPVSAGEIIVPPDGNGLYTIRHGNGGATTRMICGFFGCDRQRGNSVIAMLPTVMKIGVEDIGPAEWIRSTLEYAASEVAMGRPGSETVLAKLSELLFVEAVRRYVETMPKTQTGWLAGLADPGVAQVMALLHADIQRDWGLEDLARGSGLSRSVLADRFTRIVGMPPIQYLAHWRMQVAAHELANSRTSLARIAELVGYESEAAFSRAFKKTFGSAPATWRRVFAH
jgi:AraC-like DNA-binding protein